jgi:hypothetical protein
MKLNYDQAYPLIQQREAPSSKFLNYLPSRSYCHKPSLPDQFDNIVRKVWQLPAQINMPFHEGIASVERLR